MAAIITNIQQFSTHDGPGIRSTVFLKGCSLKCKWCANPENISLSQQLMYKNNKCINCGYCIKACPKHAIDRKNDKIIINRNICDSCGKCADVCCTEACSIIGKKYGSEELMGILKKDKVFYDSSGGGVTFSGGEPLLFTDFLIEMAVNCNTEGIHIAVETCGNVPWDNFEKLESLIDLFLFDLKILNAEKHRQYCEDSNERILHNFTRLCDSNNRKGKIIVRIPVIFGVNDNKENLKQIGELIRINANKIEEVHCLPYHNLGISKYDALGITYQLSDIDIKDNEYMKNIQRFLKHYHSKIKIGG